MNLVNVAEYRKLKSELGLTVESIERRLLNISHGELTEDLLINAIMKEGSATGENDSAVKNKRKEKQRTNSSNFYYDENSESDGKMRKQLNEEGSDHKQGQLSDNREIQSRKSHNSKKKKKSDTNSAGQTGSSSNRYFDKRRSSSKSDVETARFNRIEGLASSRNFDNSAKHLGVNRIKNAKNVDHVIAEEQGKAEPESGIHNGNLLNTFSTIKPTDQFEILNNSSSKQQKNLLKQLEKHVRYPTCITQPAGNQGQDSFEFTNMESRNVSSNPTIAYEMIVHSNTSQEGAVPPDLAKNSNLKDTLSSNQTKTWQNSGDNASKGDEDKKLNSKRSKKNLKSNSQDIGCSLRKGSKSREHVTKKVIDNITKILESINKSTSRLAATKEERSILESINSLHVFEFKNACVLGLDLKDCPEIHKASETSLLGSVLFRQLIHNIGILRVRNCAISSKFMGQVTHSNIILLSLNQCNLTSLTFLKGLDSLKLLNVSDNQLKSLSGVQKCLNLAELYANNNQLTTLAEIRTLKSLKVLSVAQNVISDISELQGLKKCQYLAFLRIAGNPLCIARDHVALIHSALPKAKIVENIDVEVH